MDDLIPTVNKLQDVFNTLGQDQIDLPQIVVIGSQSSGKSSVLENLVGMDFLPRGSGVVTRRPLVLQLINIAYKASESSSPDHNSEYAQFLHCPNRRFTDMNDVKIEIEKETDRVAGKNKGIVKTPIHLKIFSPKVLNLTMIDLPGITKVFFSFIFIPPPLLLLNHFFPTSFPLPLFKTLPTFTLLPNLDPCCVILAVSPANVDLANSESLKIAREVDPENRRTLGVLTKIDLMDKGTSAIEILTGRVYPLRLGFVGVICRSQEDTDSKKPISASLHEESNFFNSNPLYRSIIQHCGTQNLAKTMNSILIAHIKERLPETKNKINALISKTENTLSSFGPVNDKPSTNNLPRLLKIITQFSSNFSSSVEGTLADMPTNELSGGARLYYIFQNIYASGLENINPVINLTNDDIRTAIRNSSGTRASLFVPELAFQLLIKPLIKSLEPPSQRLVQLAYEELIKISNSCDTNELRRFPKLHAKVINVVSQLLRERVQPTSAYVESLISIERAYINTNHPDFIGGAGALSELQKRAERKKRDLAKNMLINSAQNNQKNSNFGKRIGIKSNSNDSKLDDDHDYTESSDNDGVDNSDTENGFNSRSNIPNQSLRNRSNISDAKNGNPNNTHGPNNIANLRDNRFNKQGHNAQDPPPNFFSAFFGNESAGNPGNKGSKLNNSNYGQNQANQVNGMANKSNLRGSSGHDYTSSYKYQPSEIPIPSLQNTNSQYHIQNQQDGYDSHGNPNRTRNISIVSGSHSLQGQESIDDTALFITQKLNSNLSLNERDELETTLIRLLITSYFQIVRKQVMDLVPKAIMHFLVNEAVENLQNRLVEELYSESIAQDLMQEDQSLLNEYNQTKAVLEIYKNAFDIICDII
ncbi:Dynamin-related protein DNM1 [Smittium culicis]|uniref:Dynamin-related protein DNM1 n=1 Tax=Smittium culicis TaxID=133412 RepID=A0A1R1YPH0_9FUNG|nr:Dynamin-related protein DNM1 [Smittium culicis]